MIKHLINRIAGWVGIKRRLFILPEMTDTMPISISYAITVCHEAEALATLLDTIQPHLLQGDEIVIQADKGHVTPEVKAVVQAHAGIVHRYAEHDLHMDFAQAKNHLNTLCNGQWIFQLDADERPSESLLRNLQAIVRSNKVELIKLPRRNLFTDRNGRPERDNVAWPDYQGRLYHNAPQRIRWYRPIHEKIRGHKAYCYLPAETAYALIHSKITEHDNAKWQTWKQHFA